MRKGGAEGTKSSRSMLSIKPATSSGISPRPPDAASWVISPLTQPTAYRAASRSFHQSTRPAALAAVASWAKTGKNAG